MSEASSEALQAAQNGDYDKCRGIFSGDGEWKPPVNYADYVDADHGHVTDHECLDFSNDWTGWGPEGALTDFGSNPQHADLSEEAVAVLQAQLVSGTEFEPEAKEYVSEDFGMSQFWYDDDSAAVLAQEGLRHKGRIGFISCPTAFKAMKKIDPLRQDVLCFEYDKRFGQLWSHEYVFYDFNEPFAVPDRLKGTFDFVMADPPYLNKQTLGKFVETMRVLAKSPETPLAINTGATLEDAANELGFTHSGFEPGHSCHIMNKFLCYTNYKSPLLAKYSKASSGGGSSSLTSTAQTASLALDELGCAAGYFTGAF